MVCNVPIQRQGGKNKSQTTKQWEMHLLPSERPSKPLRELIVRLLDGALDPQQDGGLPLVQLAHLVVRVQLVGVLVLVALLDGPDQVHQQLVLALRREARVHVPVLLERPLRGDHVARREVAQPRLEEVLLDAVAHQVVVDGLLRHLLVLIDRLGVVAIEGGDVGYFEPELVREAVVVGRLSVSDWPCNT